MSTRIEFEVVGVSLPAGSKKAVPVIDRSGNPVRTKAGRILTRVKHDNPNTVDWMSRVAQRAREVYQGPLLKGPLKLTLTFVRQRPNGHFGTGRNAGKLKKSAAKYPTTRPDTVKLTRAVEDALTKVLWCDDSQVCEHDLRKVWGEYAHVGILIETLGGGDGN